MRLLQSDDGASLVEFLISMAIAAIVVAGMYDLYTTFSKSNLAQFDIIETQNTAQAAMDIMVKELQRISAPPTITSGGVPVLPPNPGDTIIFDRQDASGFSTGSNSSTTLNDTTAAWAVNAFAPTATVTYSVSIVLGTGVGQLPLTISSNTATQLTTATAWTPLPDATSRYSITHLKQFTRTADNKLQMKIGTGPLHLVADNITALSFSFSVNTTTINLTARTRNKDMNLGTYKSFSRNDTAIMRN